MSSASTTETSARRTRPRWGYRIVMTSLAILAGSLMLAIITAMFGSVHGEEFSPHQLRRRSFFYYELPLVHVQVWPIRRHERTGKLSRYLKSNGLITTTNNKNPRWDLLYSDRGGRSRVQGDAAILSSYLDTRADKGLYWLQWSQNHNKLANVLWPEVIQTARQQMYVFIPDLFAAAEETSSAADLQTRFNEILGRRYRLLAETQQELGKHDLAVKLFDEALRYLPQDAKALAGREKSAQSLPKAEAESE